MTEFAHKVDEVRHHLRRHTEARRAVPDEYTDTTDTTDTEGTGDAVQPAG